MLKDIQNVTFLDIGPKFLDEKGYLSKEMMPDTTHPSAQGHEICAKAIEPELKKMVFGRTHSFFSDWYQRSILPFDCG